MERDDVFFELQTSFSGNGGPKSRGMEHVADVEIMASKTYLKGLILVVIFHDGSYFAQIQDGGKKAQALLDVKYPDLSSKGTWWWSAVLRRFFCHKNPVVCERTMC